MTIPPKHYPRVAFVFMNNQYQQIGRGAGYVIGAILDAGFPVEFYDTFQVSPQTILQDVMQQKFDVFMVSTMSQYMPDAVALINQIKAQTDIPVLLGGVHAISIGAPLLEQHPAIDFLCIGEGESMVADFLTHFGTDALYDIPNLAYRRAGQVISNPLSSPEDFSTLPRFPWRYLQREAQLNPVFMMASRGCPYRCSYCANTMYLATYGPCYLRYRLIDHVIDEMDMLMREYATSSFYFLDEMMLMKFDYVEELFTTIKKRFNVPFALQGRAEHVTGKLVELLQATGCDRFTMGVECGNEAFRRKHLNRHMTNDQLQTAFSLLHEAGIMTVANNIIGFPFEYDNKLTKETIEFNLTLRPGFANFNIFYPYPGTPLYDYCMEHDLIDPIKQQEYTRDQDSILRGVTLADKLRKIAMFVNIR